MEKNAQWTIPPAHPNVNRTVYYYRGSGLRIAGINIEPYHSVDMLAEQDVIVENGGETSYLLLLQGEPINEPVAQHGPFVMNNSEEISQAFIDYRRTQFGGWPWERYDPVHGPDPTRFAKYSDGNIEEPGK